MAAFEQALRTLLQEVGRRIMAWVINHLEPTCPEEMPARLWWTGRVYRRRRTHRTSIATLFGPVVLWRRLYEPLRPGVRAIHPLELRLGIAGGVAIPALAKRIGGWAAEHAQRQVLALLRHDHGVHWSCTTLRKLLGCLRTGMGAHRQDAQVNQIINWLHRVLPVSQLDILPRIRYSRIPNEHLLPEQVWSAGCGAMQHRRSHNCPADRGLLASVDHGLSRRR